MCGGATTRAAVGTLADSSGEAVGWGQNHLGQTDVPPGLFTAVGAAWNHSLAIRKDGTLAGWGSNQSGVSDVPAGTFSHISAGGGAITLLPGVHSLGIRSDGTLSGWGENGSGQINVPSGIFTAVSAGYFHSVAIRSDGTLAAWGDNQFGQTSIPAGLFKAIAAGGIHNVAIRNDGTLVGWGNNQAGQIAVPTGTFSAIAAGRHFSLGLRIDGTLAGWGSNSEGQINVPSGTFNAIAAGDDFGLAIRTDGTLVGWTDNALGQIDVPSGAFVAIDGGRNHGLALRARTHYDDGLLVRYAGAAPYGPDGLKANLNRLVTVEGDVRIESPMYQRNNPSMLVDGKFTVVDSRVVGAGTFVVGGRLEIVSAAHFEDGVAMNAEGPLTGAGRLHLAGANTRLAIGLKPTSSFTGAIQVEPGAVLEFDGPGIVTPSMLNNSGDVRLAAGQRLRTAAAGSNSGIIRVTGDRGTLSGAAELELGGTLPTVQTSTGKMMAHDAALRFEGGLANQGAVELDGGVNDVFGDINNTGDIVVRGAATFYDDIVQNGVFDVKPVGPANGTAVILGSFTGDGGTTGGGDIFFEGDLKPGNSPATVTFDNNIALGDRARTEIELGGAQPGVDYDRLNVLGQLTLGGALDVSLVDGFVPKLGQSFDILDWQQLSGTFSSIRLPQLAGMRWDASQLYATGALTIAPAALVPEPAGWMLGAAAALALHLNCRRLRRTTTIAVMAPLLAWLALGDGRAAWAQVGTLADTSGEAVGWGFNDHMQTNVPPGSYKAIAAGGGDSFFDPGHSLAIRSDGTLAGWGNQAFGQLATPPGTFTAIAAGGRSESLSHLGFHSLAIRTDGTLVGFGSNGDGQTAVPEGVYTAIAAGAFHSVAIKTTGSLAAWGSNAFGQTSPPNGSYTAVAAGSYHNLAIADDGTLVGWGRNTSGQTNVAVGTFLAVAAGEAHSIALHTDGTLRGWGDNSFNQAKAQEGRFSAIAAGRKHSIGLRTDGTLVGWGSSSDGRTAVPSGVFTAIAAGGGHNLALRARTHYEGDLAVSYTGTPYGANGLKAHLNRSVTVAGNALINSPMYLDNNPAMDVGGTITVVNTTIDGAGNVNATGSLEFGGTVRLSGGVNVSSQGPLVGAGTVIIGGGQARLTAGLTPASSFTGNLQTEPGSVLSFTGAGVVTPNTMINHGELRVAAGQRIEAIGPGANDGRIEALGNRGLTGGAAELRFRGLTTNDSPAGLIAARDAILRFVILRNTGGLAFVGGANDVFGDVENEGDIVVSGGATAMFHGGLLQHGNFRVAKVGATTSTAVIAGAYSGFAGATGGGDIVFEGEVRPGSSPGKLTFDNNVRFNAAASLKMEIGGTIPEFQHDQLDVLGALMLGGSLDVSLIGGFVPTLGQTFDLLDWGSVSGAFANVSLPALANGLRWDRSQLYTKGMLSVAPAYEADFDEDGDVDGDDLVQWQGDFGANDFSDADDDGDSDGADFLTWQRQVGSGATVNGAVANVPEPGGIMLALAAMLGAAARGGASRRWTSVRLGSRLTGR
jgi:alpha-tubulin suppressor-like RCC1 family protein